METKHTPGPWKIVRDASDFIQGVEVDSGWICDTQFNSIPSCEANAKLIAAAPDLLEALQEVIKISDRNHIAWDKAKAAIQKATT